MKSLFDSASYTEILQRLNKLTPQSQRQWGKMDVAQMMAHCSVAFKVPLSEKPMPRMFMGRLMGWMFKPMMHNDSVWKKNVRTAPEFIINDSRDYEKEKSNLLSLITKFNKANPQQVEQIVHPFFGKFTGEQWGKMMYKHLDHHLTQFGA